MTDEGEEDDHLSQDERHRVRGLLEWTGEKEHMEDLRSIVRYAPEIVQMVEGHLFWKAVKRHAKAFGAWLAGFVAFMVALRDLFGLGRHG